ncbi:uncharacterized protein LOC131160221 [Malania oleifera]|uniref:uncharacterized protein LOC131160221 n=1 Tax=Malania oleifera TaxID=397392 RepID=UPI0025ADC5A0|nr:uncharacterized protein LOC131160221 [Malania oleifera]
MERPEDDQVEVVKKLISSLSEEIPCVQNFKGKWSVIKAKLADLQSQCCDFSDFPGFFSCALSAELLNSLSQTLTDAVSLAGKCRDPTLTEGKLKTQSEVDAISAKLDRHIRDGEVLIRSGVLQDGLFPGPGESMSSKREAVRVESRSLITRLQIGNQESKKSAMDSLLRLIQEDDKHVMIAVAQGVVPVLVRLLDSNHLLDSEMKEKTISAISRVSMVESSKNVLLAEGVFLLNHLLRVLESGSGISKEKACLTLQSLTFSKENARLVGSRGGISSLLEICESGTPSSQALAAGVLRNLANFKECKENFMEESAIPVLIRVSSSGTVLAQENAIGCLCNLVSDDVNLKLLVAREGGIECLKTFWDGALVVRSLEVAVEMAETLASCRSVAEALVSDGFVSRLVGVLNCGVLGVRIAAAHAVNELGFSPKMRKEMGECGCVSALIGMLEGKAFEEKEAAVKALSNLLSCAENKKIFRKDERGMVSVVQLLDPMQSLDKKYPVSVLALLVHSKKCRKQMVAAGACGYLKKLVEMDVEGARKLLESLGRSKVWGVFSRSQK